MDTLYFGIDWSEAKHDVCILNKAEAILKEFMLAQTVNGHEHLEQEIKSFDMMVDHCLVGLEMSSNLVMGFLEPRPYVTYVISLTRSPAAVDAATAVPPPPH